MKSKPLIVIVFCFLIFSDSFAQDTVSNTTLHEPRIKVKGNKNLITFSPFLMFKYERCVNPYNTVSVGMRVHYFATGKYIGQKIKPFIRFYRSGVENIGSYVELNANFGNYTGTFDYGTKYTPYVPSPGLNFGSKNGSSGPAYTENRNFNAYGAGIAFGKQWRTKGRIHFVIDWEIIGLNITPFPTAMESMNLDGQTYKIYHPSGKSGQDTKWYAPFSPGSVLSSMISIGFRF